MNLDLILDSALGGFFLFVFGLIWGSFFNVCISRLPREKGLGGRSECPGCKKKIRALDNIPILSYLILRGKCRHCKAPISIQYPLVELFTGLMCIALFKKFGFSIEWLGYFLFFSLLLVISVIDLYHRIIPDVLSLGGIGLGVLFSFFWDATIWWHSILGVVLGGGVFLAVATFYEKLAKQEGLGGGDIKLLAMIGAWLGFQSILVVVLVSSATGSLIGGILLLTRKGGLKSAIPFGPFLALGACVYALWGTGFAAWLYPNL